jgi:3-oxoadipate enol-lactonase
MQSIKIGEISLNVSVRGQGPALLFVHGYPLDHTMWRQQADDLARDYLVICPDLRGFGQSSATPGIVTMQRYADDLAALLEALDVRDRLAVCGLSMGGYIAFQFALRHRSRLSKLVLCDTKSAADTPEAAKARLENAQKVLAEGAQVIVDAMLPKLFALESFDKLPDVVKATRKVMLDTKPEGIAAALRGMAERPDVTAELKNIDVPVLVLCGEQDVISPPSEMRVIAEKLPNARFVSIAGAGHMSPLEKPAEVNGAMRTFLADV